MNNENYFFLILWNKNKDKTTINFAYIIIQYDSYKYYSSHDCFNCPNKFSSSGNNFINKFIFPICHFLY